MGLIRAELSLSNARRSDLSPMNVSALADTGALHLCIPQHVALQLALETLETREVTIADGTKHRVPYVGPISVKFANRSCFTGAMVLGDEVLLGAIPMEDLDLVLRPATQDVSVNPKNPNIPASIAMGMRAAQRDSNP